jgi:hypothetical protein
MEEMLSRGGEGSVSVVLGSLYSAVSERVVNDEAVSQSRRLFAAIREREGLAG